MKSMLLFFAGLLLFTGCQQQDNELDPLQVDFTQVNWYATRAALAYQSEAEIRKALPNTVLVATTPNSDVQYFLERDPDNHRQIIVVRGTDNLVNIRDDADYIPSRNPKLGIYLHRGFDEDASQIFDALLPQLDKQQTVIVTGHSLGAAIATVLMMYLHEEGFTVGPSINFGQPKVTNHAGVEKYQFLPLLRVVDEDDVVPLVPPEDFLDSLHGAYEHIGPELRLLVGKYYTYQTHHQLEQFSIDSFWRNLGSESVSAHYMKHYLQNITSKLQLAVAVPYDQRDRYSLN